MNGLWNLDPIYKGFDDPAFEADLEQLKQKVAEIAIYILKLSLNCFTIIYINNSISKTINQLV